MKKHLCKQRKYIGIFMLTLLLGGLINHFSTYNLLHLQNTSFLSNSKNIQEENFVQNVNFSNIESEKIRSTFISVWQKYSQLHDFQIQLVMQEISGSTMQAQPIITLCSLLSGKKRYQININPHLKGAKDLKVNQLPKDALEGWFAHELGHLVDYKQHSNVEMIWYGLKYYFSSTAKKTVEYDADYIAIANGFKSEIIAMKKYILENEEVSISYKDKIKNFYLPREEVMVCAEDKDLLQLYLSM